MSRYGYDYSLAPTRSSGWRSFVRNSVMVGTIAAISAISGAVVALDLLGSGSTTADRPSAVATPAQPANINLARTVTPPQSQPANAPSNAVTAAVAQPRPAAANAAPTVVAQARPTAANPAAPQPTAQPTTAPAAHVVSAPQAAPAPQPAPAASVAAVEEPWTVRVPERQLTFSNGYARRRAAQEAATAATAGTGGNVAVARIESQTQVGRAAKVKPKTLARQNGPQDQRHVAEAFSRFDQPGDRGDFSRHQALAFGDPRDPRANRRPPPQQQGGLGGFFRGLF